MFIQKMFIQSDNLIHLSNWYQLIEEASDSSDIIII